MKPENIYEIYLVVFHSPKNICKAKLNNSLTTLFANILSMQVRSKIWFINVYIGAILWRING